MAGIQDALGSVLSTIKKAKNIDTDRYILYFVAYSEKCYRNPQFLLPQDVYKKEREPKPGVKRAESLRPQDGA